MTCDEHGESGLMTLCCESVCVCVCVRTWGLAPEPGVYEGHSLGFRRYLEVLIHL